MRRGVLQQDRRLHRRLRASAARSAATCAASERRPEQADLVAVRVDDDDRRGMVDRIGAVLRLAARVDQAERVRQRRQLFVAAGGGDERGIEEADVARELFRRVAAGIDRDEIEAHALAPRRRRRFQTCLNVVSVVGQTSGQFV